MGKITLLIGRGPGSVGRMTGESSGKDAKLARQQRQAAALRANLQRRKAQARAQQGAAAGAQATGETGSKPAKIGDKTRPRG
jgi:hypothetical protein